MKIPQTGLKKDDVSKELLKFKSDESLWENGKLWSLVYHVNEEHDDMLKETLSLFHSENFLNPMVFKGLKKMEEEIVRMIASLLNGNDEVVGTMTSGGTESILLALKTYRDRAIRKNPFQKKFEVILPETAHVAFEKAAKYFGLKLVLIPLNDKFTVNVEDIENKINRNTILIVASAPQYPHGIMDPIPEISKVALKHKVPFHVDSCVGGLILPWLTKLGEKIPAFDFRLEGVTSISADIHKYGYATKGSSVILYKNGDYLRDQFFVSTDWQGGIYASPTMLGTRPGSAVASAWASIMSLGEEGYLKLAKEIIDAREELKKGIQAIDGLYIMGDPQTCIVAFSSNDKNLDLYSVADIMAKKGWHVDRQQKPPSIHLTITANHKKFVPQYLADLREATAYVKSHPETKELGDAPMYGLMARIPIRSMVKNEVVKVMMNMYAPKSKVESGGAEIAPLPNHLKVLNRFLRLFRT